MAGDFLGGVGGDFLGGVGVTKTGSTFRGRVEDLFVSGQGVISWVCESHFWGRVE